MISKTEFKIYIYGLEQKLEIIEPSKELILLGKQLDGLERKPYQKIGLRQVKKDSENFMKNHFNLHKILFVDPDIIKENEKKLREIMVLDQLDN